MKASWHRMEVKSCRTLLILRHHLSTSWNKYATAFWSRKSFFNLYGRSIDFSILSEESFSQTLLSSKQKGFCSVCQAVFSLQKNGTVHQLGPRDKPFPGSHMAPISNIMPSSTSSPNQPSHKDTQGTSEKAMDSSTIYDYSQPQSSYLSLFSDKPAITQPTLITLEFRRFSSNTYRSQYDTCAAHILVILPNCVHY